jgi:hypothetical protein
MKKLIVMASVFSIQFNSFAGQNELTRALGEFRGQLRSLELCLRSSEAGTNGSGERTWKELLEKTVGEKLQIVLNFPLKDAHVPETLVRYMTMALNNLNKWATKIDDTLESTEKKGLKVYLVAIQELSTHGVKMPKISTDVALIQWYGSLDTVLTKALMLYRELCVQASKNLMQEFPANEVTGAVFSKALKAGVSREAVTIKHEPIIHARIASERYVNELQELSDGQLSPVLRMGIVLTLKSRVQEAKDAFVQLKALV